MASATDTDTSAVRVDEALVEVATTVSPEVKVAATQAVLSEGNVEVTKVLCDQRDETLALVQRSLASADIKGTFSLPESEENESIVDVEIADACVEQPTDPAHRESSERLSDAEKTCLKSMKEDFDRGIVSIDDNADKDAYQAALEEDKTAGQSWEAIQGRLLANKAALLKKAVELSKLTGYQEGKDALLVGVYENGELAIKQRSQEIVNARWTKDWKDGQSDKGELKLLFHPDAMTQETGRWAKAVEILRAVKAAGYHVPADAPDYSKKGLVAASEAVTTGAHYVMSPNNGNEWRDAMLECKCPDNDVADNACVRVVYFNPDRRDTRISAAAYANSRHGNRGAVLWLRG